MFGKIHTKLPEKGFLLRRRLGNAAESDFATVGSETNDAALCRVESSAIALMGEID